MSITIFGIPNCDTMKKARRWLDNNNLDYAFHDYKKLGIDQVTLQEWCEQLGFEVLLNQRGTTWRKLSEDARANVDTKKAIALMVEQPSLIKRPVLASNGQLLVGFKESEWQSLL